RKALTKEAQKMAEDAKIAVRNVRREAMDKFKAQKKNSELTEDDQKRLEEEMQKVTDKFIKKIDQVCEDKIKEIMEI
ncbi:MAG: ribosome-recycling factor, partial [Pygmaiobacter sp.]|nr:ribosome-recycling factor [Pygmaiobacter sp.]